MVEIRTRETSHGGKSVTIFKDGEPTDFKPNIPKMPVPSQHQKENIEHGQKLETSNQGGSYTDKAMIVNRVAKRLGWIKTEDPEETIRYLSKEAEKMKENVYKYLDSLANLGKKYCHESNPECIRCPMNDGCQFKSTKIKKQGLFHRK
jgi:hypothetical protein